MDVQQRTCLKCGKPFDSAGPGNRICGRCALINDRLPKTTEADLQKERGVRRRNGVVISAPTDDDLSD